MAFSKPRPSVVSFSEEQAMDQANDDVLVFTPTLNPAWDTISERQEKIVLKLLVIGASMCGPDTPKIYKALLG